MNPAPQSLIRHPQLVSRILCHPWNVSPDRGRALISAILLRLRSERPEEDVYGDPLPKMQIVGDVAVIPIVGSLMVNAPDWLKKYGCGITDANDIAEELDLALNNPAVRLVALDIDSPGGESIAGDKLLDLVEEAGRRKPILSFCADGACMASSAYECAAPSLAIYAGKYACVGSIGSYLAFLDDTEFWKMFGITWEVFRSGEIKGLGEDALNDTQREFLQGMVDTAGANFRARVQRYRTAIDPADMSGAWWYGAESAQRGFIAGTVKDLSAAIAKFRQFI